MISLKMEVPNRLTSAEKWNSLFDIGRILLASLKENGISSLVDLFENGNVSLVYVLENGSFM